MIAPNTQSAAGLLTIEQVASELATSRIAASRLIARGALPAYRLGPNGPQRVHAADVAKYVAAGTPDFAMPPLRGAWFDDRREIVAARTFAERAAKLIGDAVPAEAPSASTVRVGITPAMRALIATPVDAKSDPDKSPRRFGVYGLAWAVCAFRDAAYEAAGRGQAINALYADRDAYRRIVAAAGDTFNRASMNVTKIYTSKDVSFGVKYSDILNVLGYTTDKLAEMAL
ncbi:MAG: hypothetical protein GC162_19580 [Planctomycetes bacterium]|nr:hypothetical protein [Planctomycetota bacterium]